MNLFQPIFYLIGYVNFLNVKVGFNNRKIPVIYPYFIINPNRYHNKKKYYIDNLYLKLK